MTGVRNRGVALVTGGGQGIGAAAAGRLAADGAAVAVVDLNEQAAEEVVEAIREKGGKAVAVSADVTDREQVQAAVNRTVAELGGLHILVNNAGVTRDNLLFKMSDDDWGHRDGVHLRGAFLMTRPPRSTSSRPRTARSSASRAVSALGNRGQANYAAVWPSS